MQLILAEVLFDHGSCGGHENLEELDEGQIMYAYEL